MRGINAIYLKALTHYWQDSASLRSSWPYAFAKSRSEIFMATVFATTSSVIPRTIRRTSIQSRRGNLVSRGRNFSLPVSSGVPPFELTSKRYRKRVAPFPKELRSENICKLVTRAKIFVSDRRSKCMQKCHFIQHICNVNNSRTKLYIKHNNSCFVALFVKQRANEFEMI